MADQVVKKFTDQALVGISSMETFAQNDELVKKLPLLLSVKGKRHFILIYKAADKKLRIINDPSGTIINTKLKAAGLTSDVSIILSEADKKLKELLKKNINLKFQNFVNDVSFQSFLKLFDGELNIHQVNANGKSVGVGAEYNKVNTQNKVSNGANQEVKSMAVQGAVEGLSEKNPALESVNNYKGTRKIKESSNDLDYVEIGFPFYAVVNGYFMEDLYGVVGFYYYPGSPGSRYEPPEHEELEIDTDSLDCWEIGDVYKCLDDTPDGLYLKKTNIKVDFNEEIELTEDQKEEYAEKINEMFKDSSREVYNETEQKAYDNLDQCFGIDYPDDNPCNESSKLNKKSPKLSEFQNKYEISSQRIFNRILKESATSKYGYGFSTFGWRGWKLANSYPRSGGLFRCDTDSGYEILKMDKNYLYRITHRGNKTFTQSFAYTDSEDCIDTIRTLFRSLYTKNRTKWYDDLHSALEATNLPYKSEKEILNDWKDTFNEGNHYLYIKKIDFSPEETVLHCEYYDKASGDGYEGEASIVANWDHFVGLGAGVVDMPGCVDKSHYVIDSAEVYSNDDFRKPSASKLLQDFINKNWGAHRLIMPKFFGSAKLKFDIYFNFD
ncbi:MAG: hypothetical protein HUJ68_03625 [Clostridia bacterium]|nr:hypothetical protein [Clostridia bacterium]